MGARPDRDRYEIGKLIGQGGYGKVVSAVRRSDRLPVALKYISRNEILDWHTADPTTTEPVPLEVALLQHLQAVPSVIRLLEYFELDACPELALGPCFVLVMERPDGVDLFEYVGKKKGSYLNELQAYRVFAQVLQAVIDIHKLGVVHCDIKDENIIIEQKTGKIKLIDFGCGAFLEDRSQFFYSLRGKISICDVVSGEANIFCIARVGTKDYATPEWVNARWYEAESSTVWQLGILLYSMLFSVPPFLTEEQIIKKELTWPRSISEDCRSIISRCLHVDWLERPTLSQLSEHAWISPARGALSATAAMGTLQLADCASTSVAANRPVQQRILENPMMAWASSYPRDTLEEELDFIMNVMPMMANVYRPGRETHTNKRSTPQ